MEIKQRHTHILENGQQATSAGEKHTNQAEALTSWEAEDSHCSQERNRATKQRDSQTEEHQTGNFNWGQPYQLSKSTHILKSRRQAML